MIVEKKDLYEYFGLDRGDAKCGTLTAFRHSQMPELGVEKTRPAMLVIPGGGYSMVSEREAEPIALRYFADGYDAFVLDYDVAPLHYPLQIAQAAMAMLYLRREAERLYLDGEHIAAVGFSAGGHLLGCISLLWDDPALSKLFGEECERIRPDASVYAYPVISCDENIWHEGTFRNFCADVVPFAEYSLEKKVRASASPSFIWATTTDDVVPVENALLLYSALHKAGVTAELHLFSKGGHGLSTCDDEVYPFAPQGEFFERCKKWIGMSLEFLRSNGFGVRTIE